MQARVGAEYSKVHGEVTCVKRSVFLRFLLDDPGFKRLTFACLLQEKSLDMVQVESCLRWRPGRKECYRS